MRFANELGLVVRILVRSGYRAAAASQSERWVASRLVIHLALCVDPCAVVAVAAGHGGQRVPTVELLPVPAAACPADLAEIWHDTLAVRHARRQAWSSLVRSVS